MKTVDWKPLKTAKALIIGHDPRLQKSETIAECALFTNYYFNSVPNKSSEKRKYGLAKKTINQILFLTNNKIDPNEIYVTNLCSNSLPHAPKGKTVLIPECEAIEGLKHIENILFENPSIEYIFPMSLQVNYWLQKLEFYNSDNGFLEKSQPKQIGIINDPPYYCPLKTRTFLLVCGNAYKTKNGNHIVIPTLHSKCYPLPKNFVAYQECYDKTIDYFK